MDKRKKNLAVIVTAVVLAGTGISGISRFGSDSHTNKIVGTNIRTDYEALEEKKEYTVLVYMNGSDLENEEESAATDDIQEMMETVQRMYPKGEESNFHLVIETGGSKKWNMQARFSVMPSGIKHLETFASRNMGDKSTFADFLNFGMMSFPAEKYLLVCWNHGNGPLEGFGSDVLYDGDSLRLEEMQEAFELSRMQEYPFELVGFDACLMGTVETVYMMPKNVKYMVASPELEPVEGWNYQWLEILGEENRTGEEIGEKIGREYVESGGNQEIPLALTVTDVEKLQEKCREWNEQLEEKVWEEEELWEVFAKRNQMQEYQVGTMGSQRSELVGCESIMKEICGEEKQPGELLDGIATIFGNEAACEKQSRLSIYFPEEIPDYEEMVVYETCGFIDGYYKLLRTSYDMFGENSISYEEQKAEYEAGKITTELQKELVEHILQITQVTYLKNAEGEKYIISTDTDVELDISTNTVTAKVPEYYMALQGVVFAALEESVVETEEEDYVNVLSPIMHNGVFSYLEVRYSEEYPDGKVQRVIPVSEDGKSLKQIYSLDNGDKIAPLYPLTGYERDETDMLAGYYKGDEFVVEWEDEERCMQSVQIDRALLEYGFLVKIME